jgi:bifunctional non-homologous end joining protein LigD
VSLHSRPYRGSAREAKAIVSRPGKTGGAARVTVAGVGVSHPDRVFFPKDGITKVELARYYATVAEWMLPHVRGRPLTLVRCPENIEQCAYMRHLKAWRHWPALRIIDIVERHKVGEYLVADSAAALVSLVQMDILEVHTWNVTAGELERPDRFVIDLDPDAAVAWQTVVDAAGFVREALAAIGLAGWVKTTGGKGLHIVVPLVPRASWDDCLSFTRAFARGLERARPELFTASMGKALRRNKIFVDYLRNNRGNSSVAAFSVRARDGAPVSVPLSWDELGSPLPPLTVRTVPDRLAGLARDPWSGYDEIRQHLPPGPWR